MNILILSVGTRNKIVEYFKKEIGNDGKIVVTDMSIFAPAIYEADKYYIVPAITSPNYLNIIFDICEKEKISAVLSLIDPELSLIANNSKEFEKIGVKVIGSSYELCELSFDKYQMYMWLNNHKYKCAKSYLNLDEFIKDYNNKKISFPVVVKPYKGSASINVSKVDDLETLEFLLKKNNDLMIQEFLYGQEIGVDAYIDIISKEVVSVFLKKKIKMRAGETDKAISFKDNKLFDVIKNFCKQIGFLGEIDIDIFEINGEYYISEVNPRFGGGYPHAYCCGCNHVKYIVNNLRGIVNKVCIGDYDEKIIMMKYNEIMVKKI